MKSADYLCFQHLYLNGDIPVLFVSLYMSCVLLLVSHHGAELPRKACLYIVIRISGMTANAVAGVQVRSVWSCLLAGTTMAEAHLTSWQTYFPFNYHRDQMQPRHWTWAWKKMLSIIQDMSKGACIFALSVLSIYRVSRVHNQFEGKVHPKIWEIN